MNHSFYKTLLPALLLVAGCAPQTEPTTTTTGAALTSFREPGPKTDLMVTIDEHMLAQQLAMMGHVGLVGVGLEDYLYFPSAGVPGEGLNPFCRIFTNPADCHRFFFRVAIRFQDLHVDWERTQEANDERRPRCDPGALPGDGGCVAPTLLALQGFMVLEGEFNLTFADDNNQTGLPNDPSDPYNDFGHVTFRGNEQIVIPIDELLMDFCVGTGYRRVPPPGGGWECLNNGLGQLSLFARFANVNADFGHNGFTTGEGSIDWLIDHLDNFPEVFERKIADRIPCARRASCHSDSWCNPSCDAETPDPDCGSDAQILRNRLECFFEEQVLANAEPQKMAGTLINIGGAGGRLSPYARIQIQGVEVGEPRAGEPQHLHINVAIDTARALPDLSISAIAFCNPDPSDAARCSAGPVEFGQPARALVTVHNASRDLEAGHNFLVRLHQGTTDGGSVLGQTRVPVLPRVGDVVTIHGSEYRDTMQIGVDFMLTDWTAEQVTAVIDPTDIVREQLERPDEAGPDHRRMVVLDKTLDLTLYRADRTSTEILLGWTSGNPDGALQVQAAQAHPTGQPPAESEFTVLASGLRGTATQATVRCPSSDRFHFRIQRVLGGSVAEQSNILTAQCSGVPTERRIEDTQ